MIWCNHLALTRGQTSCSILMQIRLGFFVVGFEIKYSKKTKFVHQYCLARQKSNYIKKKAGLWKNWNPSMKDSWKSRWNIFRLVQSSDTFKWLRHSVRLSFNAFEVDIAFGAFQSLLKVMVRFNMERALTCSSNISTDFNANSQRIWNHR